MPAAVLRAAAPSLLVEMLTPAGRCNRKGFLLVASVMLATQAAVALMMWLGGAEHEGPVGFALNAAFLWLAVTATAKRLHDVGKSAWAILWALVGVMVWTVVLVAVLMATLGDAAMLPGNPGYWLSIAGAMLPVLGATLWLHFARGETGPNRYGDAPGEFGFSLPPPGHTAEAAPALAAKPARA